MSARNSHLNGRSNVRTVEATAAVVATTGVAAAGITVTTTGVTT